jgi:hypothetical protein
MLRHTHATELIRSGVAIEVVARLLTHQSSTTTSQTYVHLDVADVRAALHRAGVWDKPEVVTAGREKQDRRPWTQTGHRKSTTGQNGATSRWLGSARIGPLAWIY